jgi:hypothetical protein
LILILKVCFFNNYYIIRLNWKNYDVNCKIIQKVPDYTVGVQYNDFKEVIVASVISGYVGIDDKTGSYRNVSNEYNFFEFIPAVENKPSLFSVIKKNRKLLIDSSNFKLFKFNSYQPVLVVKVK